MKLSSLPRLDVALVVTDSESIDGRLCTRLLARELRHGAGSQSRITAWIEELVAARAVQEGGPVPVLPVPGHEAATSSVTVGESDQCNPTEPPYVSRTNAGTPAGDRAQTESDARRAYLATHWPLSELVEAPSGAAIVFVHGLPNEEELIASMEAACNGGDDAALAHCRSQARAQFVALVEQAVTVTVTTSTNTSTSTTTSRLGACADLNVVWAVRDPCLLSALAASGCGAATAVVPRAVLYLQPGSDPLAPRGDATAGSAAAQAHKRGAAAANKSGSRGGSASGKKGNSGSASASRSPARRTSGASKGRPNAGAGSSSGGTLAGGSGSGGGDAFNFFFDQATQTYNASAVERYIYCDCGDFGTFVDRQTRFQDQLRKLQSWQTRAATSAFATRRRPNSTVTTSAASPAPSALIAGTGGGGASSSADPSVRQVRSGSESLLPPCDCPFTEVLFAEDSDRLATNYQALLAAAASTTATPMAAASSASTSAVTQNVLRLLEDCLLAQRVPVPSVVALAALQSSQDAVVGKRGAAAAGAGSSMSSTPSASTSATAGAAASAANASTSAAAAAAARKRGNGNAAAASTAVGTGATTLAAESEAGRDDVGEAAVVVMPVWMLVSVPVCLSAEAAVATSATAAPSSSPETDNADDVMTAALVAALPELVHRVRDNLKPLVGIVSLYDQWRRHRPMYPLPSRTRAGGGAWRLTDPDGRVTTSEDHAVGGLLARDDFGSTHMSSTLGGLSATDAERVFFLGTTSSELQAEMVKDSDAPRGPEATLAFAGDELAGTTNSAFAETMRSTASLPTASADGAGLAGHHATPGLCAASTAASPSADTAAGGSGRGPIDIDPSRFTRYEQLKRRAGTFTPVTAMVALIAQTLVNMERRAPLRLVKLAERGAVPSSLLFATTRDERVEFRRTLNEQQQQQQQKTEPTSLQLCEEAASMGVRVEESDGGAHFASSPFHNRKGQTADAHGHATHASTAPRRKGFFRPYAQNLLGGQGDNCGTTSVLPFGATARHRQPPNAELAGLVSAMAKQQQQAQQSGAAADASSARAGGASSARSQRDSRPNTARKKSSRSPSPAGRSGSRSGALAAGGATLTGVAAMDAAARIEAATQQRDDEVTRTANSAFVVPNDHAAEQPFLPPYPQEVQWLVEQYVKRGLGYFAMTRSGGDTATATAALGSSHSAVAGGGDDGSSGNASVNNNNNAVHVLAVRRMRELESLPLRLEVPEVAATALSCRVLDANTLLSGSNTETAPVPSALVGRVRARALDAKPATPLTPLDLVKRCALPLSTFEVQLQRSVERSLTSRERQHALQKVLLVELARSGGLLSYTAVDEVAAHTGSLGTIEEVVSLDVLHRELLRFTLRFGEHLAAVYSFSDKPSPAGSSISPGATASMVNVLSDTTADTSVPPTEPVRTSTYSHNAENVYPPRRAEKMWLAGITIPPQRRRQMVFVHPYLGCLSPEQFIAIKSALAVSATTTTAGPSTTAPSSDVTRLSTAVYADLLEQHLNKRSFFLPCPTAAAASGVQRARLQDGHLHVPPLRVAGEGRQVIYPYCNAVVEVTTTALSRRCAYIKEREVIASLQYAVAPPPHESAPPSTPALPNPESQSYLTIRFDDGLILTCTPQSMWQSAGPAAGMEAGADGLPNPVRRARSNTENDADGIRPGSRKTSFVDGANAPADARLTTSTTSDSKRATRGGAAAAAAAGASTSTKGKSATRSTRTASNAAVGGAGADAPSKSSADDVTRGAQAVLSKALAASATAVAPIGPSGGIRLWHARVPPPASSPATTTASTARTLDDAAPLSPLRRLPASPTASRGPRAKSVHRAAASIAMAVTTNNFVLRCHPTTNTLSMHYFGDERRPGCVGGNGCTTSWEAVSAIHEYRGASSLVVTSLEREVTRSIDANTGTVTRIFESGATQLLFPDGAVSTRYLVEPVTALASEADTQESAGCGTQSSSSSASPPLTYQTPVPMDQASQRCIIELITSASGIRYVRRVTGCESRSDADGGVVPGTGRVAHRSIRLEGCAVQEVASYDAVHHCHMLSRSDGVCTTYYYRRRGSNGEGLGPSSDTSVSASRMAVQTPSSARKFASGGSGGVDRSGDFDVVARVTLHTDGTTITTFAGSHLSASVQVSPSLAPLLDDVANAELACNGGGGVGVAGAPSVRWAIESSRMPRVFLIPPVVPSVNGAAEGAVITSLVPTAHAAAAGSGGAATRLRAVGGGVNAASAGPSALALAQTRHDAKAGFYVMLGDGTTLRRNVQMRAVGQVATAFLETVLSRPSSTAVRVVHDSAIAILEPADAMESNRTNPAALAIAECLPVFDLALGGFRLVDRRSHVTEVCDLFTQLDVDLRFSPQSWQQLLRQLVSPTYSPHRLSKQKMAELDAQHADEIAAERQAAEAGKWPTMQRRLRDLAEGFIVDNKLLHPDVLHNLQRGRFAAGASTTLPSAAVAADSPALPIPVKEDNHRIGISPAFFARLACGEYVQYLGAADLQGILRQTDVEAGAPMFLSRGTASGEPGVQQLTLFRVTVDADTSETIASAALLAANNLVTGARSAASPNASVSASGARRGMSARVGAAKALSTYAQSSILSTSIEAQQRLTVLFSGSTPASNYLHSSAKGSTGYFLDNVVAHPVMVLRGSSRWLPPALQPPRRFLHHRSANGQRDDKHGAKKATANAASGLPSPQAGHRLVQLMENSKMAEDLNAGNTSSFELVRIFLEYEQLTLPAQNVVLQSEIQRTSTLQELGRYHEAMSKQLDEVTPDKLEEQRRLQEIYYAARKAKKEQELNRAEGC